MKTPTERPAAERRLDALHRLDDDIDPWIAAADHAAGCRT
jgi:hypothetical protein